MKPWMCLFLLGGALLAPGVFAAEEAVLPVPVAKEEKTPAEAEAPAAEVPPEAVVPPKPMGGIPPPSLGSGRLNTVPLMMSGAVTLGDLTIFPSASGRPALFVGNGTVRSFIDGSGATVTTAEPQAPMFVRDSTGRISGPVAISPGASEVRSTMPKQPNQPQEPLRSSFSSMPSNPTAAPRAVSPSGPRNSFRSMPSGGGRGGRR